MIDVATRAIANSGLLETVSWPRRSLEMRFAALTQRLNEIETAMYTHSEPEDPTPLRAPYFSLAGRDGNLVQLDRLVALGKPVLLLFADPNGATGQSLLCDISEWQRLHDEPLTVVGIGPATKQISLTRSDLPFGIAEILSPGADSSIAADYRVALTPALVLIRPNGALVGSPVVGNQGIQSLLDSLANAAAEAAKRRRDRVEASALAIGTPAPCVLLAGYDGRDHEVVEPEIGQLLLFWNPDCAYCDQLIPDLRALEATPISGMPPITLVARGSEAANQAQGFGFRTLFDDDLSASMAFGVSGTPTAVVIDGDGTIASHPARGIRAVRDLLALNTLAR